MEAVLDRTYSTIVSPFAGSMPSMSRAEMEARSISAEESKSRLVRMVNNYFDQK